MLKLCLILPNVHFCNVGGFSPRGTRCRDDPIARHGSRGGTAGVLDRKDSTLTQALARRDLIKNEREIETKF